MDFIMKPFAWLSIFLIFLQVMESSCVAKTHAKKKVDPGRNTVDLFIEEQKKAGNKSNRLIHEKSPYLLQHAFNPVDWFPWGKEAFLKAQKENKPIFLSIGYSTCHWCHVMAHESFENVDIAEILNRSFIAIKIDREERPDLDQVYMAVTQAMTGSGGWPMSLFLTPDLKPFFSGTYFPPESKYGRPGFSDLLTSIEKAWTENPKNIIAQSDEILSRLSALTAQKSSTAQLDANILDTAVKDFKRIFDSKNGGFGQGQKFPRPVALSFLLRQYDRSKDKNTLNMVLQTLDAMADGGMYDHLAGGFHRYTVDNSWRVPHFEKMLYDQALLAIVYIEAFQLTGRKKYKQVATDVLDYVLQDMLDPQGGYYSALDADSALPEDPLRHGEGAFYLWSSDEIQSILSQEEAKVFSFLYGVEKKGNAATDPQEEFVGKNILFKNASTEKAAAKWNTTVEEIDRLVSQAREKLKNVRDLRPHPHLDDKILTSWNGLMISAMAKGYQVFREPRYLKAAQKTALFTHANMYDPSSKTLYHRYRDGDVGINGNLDDYAFFTQGLLDLYEASFDDTWLTYAEELLLVQVDVFSDLENGGFFDTSGKDESVLLRMKEDYDGAEPAGNSVAALNFLRAGRILGNDDFVTKGERAVFSFTNQIKRIPMGMPHMLSSFLFQMSKSSQIVIAGRRDDPSTEKMIQAVFSSFIPNKIVYFSDSEQSLKQRPEMSFLENMVMLNEKATAYVCLDYTCKQPTDDIGVLQALLGQTSVDAR